MYYNLASIVGYSILFTECFKLQRFLRYDENNIKIRDMKIMKNYTFCLKSDNFWCLFIKVNYTYHRYNNWNRLKTIMTLKITLQHVIMTIIY